MGILKPLLTKIWGAAADPSNIESPADSKIDSGWLYGEKPPHKHMNWLQQTFSKAFAHLNEKGVLAWDNDTVYPLGAYVWSDGKVYRSRVHDNQNNTVVLPTKWQEQSLPDMPSSGDGYSLSYVGSKLFWKDQLDLDYGSYQGRIANDKSCLKMLSDNEGGNQPEVSEINTGELALNFKDRVLYTKSPDGNIISLSNTASIVDWEFTALEGQTVFTVPAGYVPAQIAVFQLGRKLLKNAYVANDAVNVVLNEPAVEGDSVVVLVWSSFTTADTYTKAQCDALFAPKTT